MTEAEKKAYLDRCTIIGQGAKAILEASQIQAVDWVPFTQNVELVKAAIGVASVELDKAAPVSNPAASA
jgi:hypothetical protein